MLGAVQVDCGFTFHQIHEVVEVGRARVEVIAAIQPVQRGDDILRTGGKRGRIPELWDGNAAVRIAAHLATWLDWKRGGPPGGQDTLLLTFGGESVPGHDTVLVVRGRYAGDALVLRRSRIP